ncbi:MAG: Ig-like domain-containing protein [Bdellovibrionales bacterium]|nr:Ig-like domain-containing protein [Massilia sp.]
MSIVNGSGTVVNTLSGGQTATIKVTVVDGKGVAAANEIVTFAATSALVQFTPSSGSALTDASGVATISIKPTSSDSAGATTVTATAVVAGKTATTSANLSVGAAPLTVGPLTFTPNPPPAKLPAFSTLQINIPITSGGQPSSSAAGLVINSLCKGDGTATIVLGSLTAGVQTATYTNNGCLRSTDVITAQVGATSQTISVGVDAANIGAIQFVGSDLVGASIVLKGSGGLGRQESALLTFRVLDQNNQGLAGVDVDFTASSNTGGLTVAPLRGTTDATGKVTTTVSSGTIPTPVRVFAQATRNGKTISGLSDTLTISTGLPIQKSMSLSATSYNIEGGDYDGVTTKLTVRLADQYGNPISDDTAVSFIAEGGAIGSSARGGCTTSNGGCDVTFTSQAFRPLDGRVTVLAYVQGLENFEDANGDGQYSCANPDRSVSSVYRPLVDACISGGERGFDQGDAFLDTNYNGMFEPLTGDLAIPFKGTAYNPGGDGKWGLNYIWRSAEIVLSSSYGAKIARLVCTTGGCRDWTAADGPDAFAVTTSTGVGTCASKDVSIRVFDVNNNPMPSDTSVSTTDADKVTLSALSPALVPSTNAVGGTIHTFTVKPDAACTPGTFKVKVTTPKGISKPFAFSTN